jgi:acyl transferase domain-containing protein
MDSSDKTKMFSRSKPLTVEDDIIISGISGRFPNSDNMQEFSENLYNKVSEFVNKKKHMRKTPENYVKKIL